MRGSTIFLICSAFLALVLSSCSKEQSCFRQNLQQDLLHIIESGLYIDQIDRNDGVIKIRLSDGRGYIYSGKYIDVYTIGLNGFWFKNGECTSYLFNEPIEEMFVSLASSEAEEVTAIREGYEDWTFYSATYSPIVIKKTIYSRNFDDRIMSINHRGFSSQAPENTLPAYRLSRLNGFRYAETDVRFTLDGVPVLLHDASIDRTSNGSGSIDKMTFEEVRQYDFGSWKSADYLGTKVPSLEEFLALCKEVGLQPVIELKTGSKDQVFQIIDLIDQYDLSDVAIYISFSPSILKTVLEKANPPYVGYLVGDITNEVILNVVQLKSQNNRVVLNSRDYKESSIIMCKEVGIPLWVWTINSKDIILKLNSYISAVTSDKIHAGKLLFDAK